MQYKLLGATGLRVSELCLRAMTFSLIVLLGCNKIFIPKNTANSIPVTLTNVRKKAAIALPTGFQYPNGITRANNGTVYVGSVTSGRILKIKPDSSIDTFFLGNDDIFASTSLRLDEQRDILWGTSPDFLGIKKANGETVRRPHRIFAIQVSTGKVLKIIPMPDAGFGNDMAIDANGGVYITDSAHPRIYYLPPGANQLQVWADSEQLRAKMPGLAGIALADNGVLVVNLFSVGKLFKLTPQPQGQPLIEEITLDSTIENPDGMQFTPDGSLILLEGAVENGNGRLLRIRNILAANSEPKLVEVLAEKLDSPVNLTITDREIWVTEARIRHRLLPGKEAAIPERFFIHRFVFEK